MKFIGNVVIGVGLIFAGAFGMAYMTLHVAKTDPEKMKEILGID